MRTIRCPDHLFGSNCVNCGGTGRVEADEHDRPWWESEFTLPSGAAPTPETPREYGRTEDSDV